VATGADKPRLLAKRSEVGYVSDSARALRGEPEAVSASEQRHLTQLARRRERQRRVDAWRPARSLLMAGIVAYTPAADPTTRSDLRVIQRVVQKIDRRLGAQ
jgi:hypothetical protein